MRTPRLATEDSHYHIKCRRDKGGNRILSPVKTENVEGGRPQSVVADGCSSCQTSHQLRGRKGEEPNSNHSFLTPITCLSSTTESSGQGTRNIQSTVVPSWATPAGLKTIRGDKRRAVDAGGLEKAPLYYSGESKMCENLHIYTYAIA